MHALMRPPVKKVVPINFTKFTGKHLCQSLFFNKVAGVREETLAQVFSCEFCEISKNSYSYRTPPVAASVVLCIFVACMGSTIIKLISFSVVRQARQFSVLHFQEIKQSIFWHLCFLSTKPIACKTFQGIDLLLLTRCLNYSMQLLRTFGTTTLLAH